MSGVHVRGIGSKTQTNLNQVSPRRTYPSEGSFNFPRNINPGAAGGVGQGSRAQPEEGSPESQMPPGNSCLNQD